MCIDQPDSLYTQQHIHIPFLTKTQYSSGKKHNLLMADRNIRRKMEQGDTKLIFQN